MTPDHGARLVRELARDCGFDLCGIAPAVRLPRLGVLAEWLAHGRHGEMDYLARSARERLDPRELLPTARSVIALGTLYNTDRPYSTEVADPSVARISRYAWGDDYHEVIGARVTRLLRGLADAAGQPFEAISCVDDGPVQERVFAEAAGLGWVGKNTCLINPERGSWFFLSAIVCSLDLRPDAPMLEQCGTCTLCVEACPTGALIDGGVLDARRCLSYLTIEVKGEIPGEWRDRLGSHVFGCDICQEVCPFNHSAPASVDPAWQPRPIFDRVRLTELAALSDETLRAGLRHSAMRRAGVRRIRRNVAAALGAHDVPAPSARDDANRDGGDLL